MNFYENVKASVTVPQVAALYGLKQNRSGMVCCPFHNDRTPSMKLNEGYFYCFGCGAHGDVIDLTAGLFQVSSSEAASKLAADFGLAGPRPAVQTPHKPRYPHIRQFREDELLCSRALTEYLHLLEEWQVRFSPQTPEDELDDRYVEACQMLSYIEYLADILTIGALEERTAVVELLLKDGKAASLQAYVNRKREEEIA